MSDKRGVAAAAAILMAAFVASRILGLGRDMIIAYLFGTSLELASYLAAFRIPDLLFQLLAGAAMGSAFIPTFARYAARQEWEDAWELATSVLHLVALAAGGAAVLLFFFIPWLVPWIVPRFPPAYQALTAELTRIMLLSPIFFGVSAIATGILQARQRFLLPALAPIVYNLSIIGGAVLLSPWVGVKGLAWGVAIGAILHLALQLPGLVRSGMAYRLVASIHHPAVRQVGRLMFPRMLGLGAVQINFLVNTILASTLAAYSLPALNFAWLLTMMPLGIFGVAISTAAFPTMAEQVALQRLEQLERTLWGTLRWILFLTIPASVGMVILGEPLITLLFQRGRFDVLSTQATYGALVFYSLGLFAHAMVEILTRAFYALSDTRTPVGIGVGAMALNILLSLVLMGPLGHRGLALSMSIAVIVEALVLLAAIQRRIGAPSREELAIPVAQMGVATILMAFMLVTLRLAFPYQPLSTLAQAGLLGATIGVGALVYLLVTHLLGNAEARGVWQHTLRR